MHIKSRICKQMYADRKQISSCLRMRLRAGGRDCKDAGINLCVCDEYIHYHDCGDTFRDIHQK